MILKSKECKLFSALLCLPLIALPAVSAHAVIFANDSLYLYSGGTRIVGQSVLVAAPGPDEGELAVCVEGAYWLRQEPTWKAGSHTFIQVAGEEIMTFTH